MIRKLDLFPSSGEGVDNYSSGPLERANLNQFIELLQIPDCKYL
jgi:hypothetical protein